MPRGLTTLLLALLATPALAQFPTVPVLAGPPNVNYPPIAKAAHVSGDVTVTFAINPDGTTTSVQLASGPPMLAGAVVEPIKKWRFKTPLPLNAQTYFEAKYAFRIKTEDDDDEEDDLDSPPNIDMGGGDIVIRPVTITGDVHSLDGSQIIDVTAASPVKVADRCPKDTNKQTPDKTDFSDYVELLRYDCDNTCTDYRVRVYRSGRVSWRGFSGVIAKGDREALIGSSSAEELLNNFQTDGFWTACSIPPVPDPKSKPIKPAKPASDDEDTSTTADDDGNATGVFLTASIGGLTKTVSERELSRTFAWRIDRAADTHRWRHVDPVAEPYANMFEDLTAPKPGMTLLIRATYAFHTNAQQPFKHLEKLLKSGESVNAADASGWTALMYAAGLQRDQAVLKFLLDAHADPNIASLHGDTALMFAAYEGTLSQPLLDHGANLNAHNADGVTPLMLLAQNSDPDELKAALTAGADANAHDNLGRTALDYLIAASCLKRIIPPPPSYGMVITTVPAVPPPCPATTPEFLESQSLLQAAMKASAGTR